MLIENHSVSLIYFDTPFTQKFLVKVKMKQGRQ